MYVVRYVYTLPESCFFRLGLPFEPLTAAIHTSYGQLGQLVLKCTPLQ